MKTLISFLLVVPLLCQAQVEEGFKPEYLLPATESNIVHSQAWSNYVASNGLPKAITNYIYQPVLSFTNLCVQTNGSPFCYIVQRSTNLANNWWQDIGFASTTNALVNFTDYTAPTNTAFYRVLIANTITTGSITNNTNQ